MKFTRVLTLFALAALSSPLSAATIFFDPPELWVDINDLPTSYTFDLKLGELPPQPPWSLYRDFRMLLGSDSLTFESFEFSEFWEPFCQSCSFPQGIYTSELALFGAPSIGDLTTETLVGSVTIGIPYLTEGVYTFGADPSRDEWGTIWVFIDDGFLGKYLPAIVDGQAVVHVVPEPATILLVLLGGIAIVARRKRMCLLWTFPLLMSAGQANAGMVYIDVLFDPPELTIDPSAGDTTAEFLATLARPDSDEQLINNISILFASMDVRLIDFEYDDAVLKSLGDFVTSPSEVGWYPNDLLVGGFASPSLQLPLLFGRLMINAEGLQPGTYSIIVNPPCFHCWDILPPPFRGEALVHVVLEPTSGWLLMIATVGIVLTTNRRLNRAA